MIKISSKWKTTSEFCNHTTAEDANHDQQFMNFATIVIT